MTIPLIPLKPALGTAFAKGFTWVDNFTMVRRNKVKITRIFLKTVLYLRLII
jgi:hypothetical protein